MGFDWTQRFILTDDLCPVLCTTQVDQMDDFELNIVQPTASPEGGPVHRGEKGKCQKNVNRRRFKVKNRGKSDINAVKMPAVIGVAPQKGDKKR